MPERSEWLVAGGGAKRNPRYHDTRHYAFEEREYHLLWRPLSRPPDAFLGDDGFPGVALTLNPRLRALGLHPRRSTFQVGYHRDCRGNKKTEIITNIARINTALCKSVFYKHLCKSVFK